MKCSDLFWSTTEFILDFTNILIINSLSQNDAEKMRQAIKHVSPDVSCTPSLKSCNFCTGPGPTKSFQILSDEAGSVKKLELDELTLTTTEEVRNSFDFDR